MYLVKFSFEVLEYGQFYGAQVRKILHHAQATFDQ